MALKDKLCRVCKQRFSPRTGLQRVCSVSCAVVETRNKRIKKKNDYQKRRDKKRLEEMKTINDHKADTQKIFNAYIRLRDSEKPCISCGQSPTQGQRHASHFRPRSTAAQLSYNFLNCHASCSQCNNSKSGNLHPYRLKLVEILTPEQLASLEYNNENAHYTKEYLKRLQGILKRRIKLYLRLRAV